MAKIIVRRTGSFQDALRKYKVLIDGEVVGKVGRNKQIEVDVPPGSHEVQMKIDWGRSEAVTVDTSTEDARLVCEPPGTTREAGRKAISNRGKDYVTLRQE
jgi:hypothetical protein